MELVNSFEIQWKHLAYKDTFCCSGNIYKLIKSIYNNRLCPHISFIDVALGFSSGKHKELMLTQMHHFINGDEDNDDPPLERKLQIPTSFNVVVSKWKPQFITIQCCINYNILPSFPLYLCWTIFLFYLME